MFTKAVLKLEGGKTFTVSAPNASEVNRYVVAARLNGKPLDRAWLSHDEINMGGVLELDMAAQPGTWATADVSPR